MKHLRAFLSQMHSDAALIHRPENIRYLSGYSGEGCLFVSKDIHAIITDFRYIEAAARESPNWEVLRTTSERKSPDVIREITEKIEARRICVETDYLTYDEYIRLSDVLTGIELVKMNHVIEDLRQIKDDAEIANIREASRIASQAFINIIPRLHPGMTEIEAKIELEFEMLRLGSEGTAFATISAAGVNGSLPHAVPSDYIIANGDLLTLDFGATWKGYLSDITRTVGFGEVSSELRDIYNTVLDAQMMALDAIKPGKRCSDIDTIARNFIDARYPDAFGHSLGHGVGLYIHENPRLGTGDETILKPGHVVTVEPGVYIPGLGGCRIEDTVIITETGIINCMHAPKELILL